MSVIDYPLHSGQTARNKAVTALSTTSQQVRGSASGYRSLLLNNSANAAATYFKFKHGASYNHAVDAPDMVLMVPAGKTCPAVFHGDDWDIATGLWVAASAAAAINGAAPSSAVSMEVNTDE